MLKRHIIVEGMDNTGKTTLLKALSQKFGVGPTISCRSIPKQDQMAWMLDKLTTGPKLFDRFSLFSESVYGPIIRNTNLFPLSGRDSFFEVLGHLVVPNNPIIILCNPGLGNIMKTFGEREQMSGVKDNAELLLDSYLNLFFLLQRATNLTVLVYDYRIHTPEGHAALLDYYINLGEVGK